MSRQLLQSVNDFAVASDEMLDVRIIIGDDLHGRAIVAHAHFDIAFVIDDIKQSFKIIGSDISFLVELIDGLFLILRHSGCHLLSGFLLLKSYIV